MTLPYLEIKMNLINDLKIVAGVDISDKWHYMFHADSRKLA